MPFYYEHHQSSDAVLKLVELTQKGNLQWTEVAPMLVPPVIAVDTAKPCFTAYYKGRDLFLFKKIHKRSLIGAYGLIFSDETGKEAFPELSSLNDLYLAVSKQVKQAQNKASLDNFIHDILTP